MVSTSHASDDCRHFICTPEPDKCGVFDRNGTDLFGKMAPWSTLPLIPPILQLCTSCWRSSVS
jgi:hypothetical protein